MVWRRRKKISTATVLPMPLIAAGQLALVVQPAQSVPLARLAKTELLAPSALRVLPVQLVLPVHRVLPVRLVLLARLA
jgi:hypothetical protein